MQNSDEQRSTGKSPASFLANLQADLPASLVVFLVALPLCLGIALASGAPLVSGLIAGIVGGIVVGFLSGSALGVSGPAAGLAVIVLTAIQDLGSFEIFLVAVILAGVIQVVFGFLKAGIIAYYFPSSVITGMLSGIGILIILKQIPHAFGYDHDPIGELAFHQPDGETTFAGIAHIVDSVSVGPLIIALISLGILILWEMKAVRSRRFLAIIPGPLVAVVTGVLLNLLFGTIDRLTLSSDHVVSIPIADSLSDMAEFLAFPDFAGLGMVEVYSTAIVLAVVGSLETLLSVEAADKLDPKKRVTPTNRELKAQGIGNMVSGLLGGLPVTQVIVRSSANIQSGAASKVSAIFHGVLLVVSVMVLPAIMNLIPLATLAAILLVVGFKLSKPAVFKRMYGQGMGQFLPFLVTILGIVFTDLLLGIGIGVHAAIVVILFQNFQLPFQIDNVEQERGEKVQITLAQNVTFLNKASVLKTLDSIPAESSVMIDTSKSVFIHPDVVEIIDNYVVAAQEKSISVEVIGLDQHRRDKDPKSMRVAVNH